MESTTKLQADTPTVGSRGVGRDADADVDRVGRTRTGKGMHWDGYRVGSVVVVVVVVVVVNWDGYRVRSG